MTRSLHALLAAWRAAVAGTAHPQPPAYDGPDMAIAGFVEDSRQVRLGDGFVARRRRRHDGSIYSDGHPFIREAAAAGAAFILAEDPPPPGLPPGIAYLRAADSAIALAWLAAAWHGFPAQALVIVGITGTDGKTSTANLLYTILRTADLPAGLISTINAYIGDQVLDTGLHVSTPEAPDVQRYLRQMVDAGLTYCVLECTSHGLAQHRLEAVAFDVAVVTNVTHEHLDYHGSWEGYLAAKGRLVAALTAPALSVPADPAKGTQPRAAVLNADDAGAMRLWPAMRPPVAVRFGLTRPADVRAERVEHGADATRFDLILDTRAARHVGPNPLPPAPPRPWPIASPFVGAFNVANMLAAAAAADVLGVPAATIVAGLEATTGISGRMERIDRGQPFPVIVDFAHTPNALAQALAAARTMTGGRVIAVFGSAGRRDVEKRRLMAEIGARDADLVVLTAEDPRTESLDEILAMMAAGCRAQGGVEGESFWRVPDRGRAIHFALGLADAADVVLICGKGHEQSMCFGVTEHPWDDREAARAALDAFLAGEPAPNLGLPTYGSAERGTRNAG